MEIKKENAPAVDEGKKLNIININKERKSRGLKPIPDGDIDLVTMKFDIHQDD